MGSLWGMSAGRGNRTMGRSIPNILRFVAVCSRLIRLSPFTLLARQWHVASANTLPEHDMPRTAYFVIQPHSHDTLICL